MASRAIAVVVAVMAVAALATGAAAQTPAGWAKEANAVCARWNAHQKAVLPHQTPKTTAGMITAIKTLIATNVTAYHELKAIPEPASERALIVSYLNAGLAIDAQFRDEIRALQTHDTASFDQHARRAGLIDQRANATLKRLGATVCVG